MNYFLTFVVIKYLDDYLYTIHIKHSYIHIPHITVNTNCAMYHLQVNCGDTERDFI